jgi:hypothetical protein
MATNRIITTPTTGKRKQERTSTIDYPTSHRRQHRLSHRLQRRQARERNRRENERSPKESLQEDSSAPPRRRLQARESKRERRLSTIRHPTADNTEYPADYNVNRKRKKERETGEITSGVRKSHCRKIPRRLHNGILSIGGLLRCFRCSRLVL